MPVVKTRNITIETKLVYSFEEKKFISISLVVDFMMHYNMMGRLTDEYIYF